MIDTPSKSFKKLTEKLFSLPPRKNQNLEWVKTLDQKLLKPHQSYPTIHVAGTNGKGSVCQKVAAALQLSGKKVGLYTSPHIVDVRERIQINGEKISEEEMISIFEPLLEMEENLSFFDLMTMGAFYYFKEKKVDIAVIEVGLGGKFDATNVINPLVSVIVSIGFDHMDVLGNTLEEIAKEKGGIIKPNVPLVTGPSGAPYFKDAIKIEEVGSFELENQLVSKAVLELLNVPNEMIERGIIKRAPCRFERHGNVIYDVAHNPAGIQKLIEELQREFGKDQKFHFVIAFARDKDWKTCLDLLLPLSHKISTIPLKLPRMLTLHELKKHLPSLELFEKEEGITVFTGSFYLMEEVIQKREALLGRFTNR